MTADAKTAGEAVKVGASEFTAAVEKVTEWAAKVKAEGGMLGKVQGTLGEVAFKNTAATLLGAVAVGAVAAKLLSGGNKEQERA